MSYFERLKLNRTLSARYRMGLRPISFWFQETGRGGRRKSETVREALDKLEILHSMPNPAEYVGNHPDGTKWRPSIQVDWQNRVDKVHGYFQDSTHSEVGEKKFSPPAIYLASHLDVPQPILAHEIWHFIEREWFMLRSLSKTAETSGPLDRMYKDSMDLAYQKLQAELQSLSEVRAGNAVRVRLISIYERVYGPFSRDTDTTAMAPEQFEAFELVRYVDYLTSSEEWLARAYAQVFASASNNDDWRINAGEEPFSFRYSENDEQKVFSRLGAESLRKWRRSLDALFQIIRWR